MNIFHKRPLGLILSITLGGFSLFAVLPSVIRVILFLVSLLLTLLSLCFNIPKTKFPKIALLSLLISFTLSFIYFEFLFYPKEYYGTESEVTAEVTSIKISSNNLQILDLETISIGDKKCSYNIKLNLYGNQETITVGSVVKFKSEISEFSGDGSFDFKSYYTSRGFSASAETAEIEIIDQNTPSISHHFEEVRMMIYERAKEYTNDSAAALFTALLLGERDMLSPQISLDFTRIGISHILALSGMHLAILFALLEKIFRMLRIGKIPRTILECIFCIGFMALTGFPLSVCRAGIMLIISSILFLLSGSKDSFTSLLLSLFIIIFITPYAALDIGLWLSVAATAGILLSSEIVHEKYGERKGIKHLLYETGISLLFSLFAVSATSAISVLNFNSVSLLSIISTLIFSILTELYVYVGIIVLIIGGIIPTGKLLIGFEAFISGAAAFLAELPFISASTSFLSVKIAFVILSLLLAALAVFKINKKNLLIIIIASAYIFVSVFALIMTERALDDDAMISYDSGADKILLKSDGEVMLFDHSLYTKSQAYSNTEILNSEGITTLDCYFVAAYSENLPESIPIILSKIATKKLMLPLPQTLDEEYIAEDIFVSLEDFRVEISFYEDKTRIPFGNFEILIPYRDSEYKSLAVTFKTEDKIYSYISKGTLEYIPISYELLYVSNTVVFGTYGKGYSENTFITNYGDVLENVILYDKKIYIGKSEATDKIPTVNFYNTRNLIYD